MRRNSTASVTVRTVPGASCSIQVIYKSGPSGAQGLEDKQADNSGLVSWSWKVGSNTALGAWPVNITCGGQSMSTSVNVIR